MTKYTDIPLDNRLKVQTDSCRTCTNNECLCIKCGFTSAFYMNKCGVMWEKNRECTFLTEPYCIGFRM